MERSEQMELEILITIRNNRNIPVDEFYKVFDCDWPTYRAGMSELYNKRMFIIARHETIPGLNRLELTGAGKCRETELLQARSNDLTKILSEPKKTKKPRAIVKKAGSLKPSPV